MCTEVHILATRFQKSISLFLPQTTLSLNQTEVRLTSTEERLGNLSIRLRELETQIQQNLADLAVARGLTEEAETASASVNLVR